MSSAPAVRRPGRPRETGDLVAATRRLICRIGQRAAEEDVDRLVALLSLRTDIDVAVRGVIVGLRRQGVTWQEIGDALGTTRQAALMRWSAAAAGAISAVPE